MARSKAQIEVNSFIAGLNTDANPLTFPPNASADEKNFVLDKNGLRTRRLGFDLEDGYVIHMTQSSASTGEDLTVGFHKWNNAGGDSTKTIIVIQVNNELFFFDGSAETLSTGFMDSYTYPTSGQLGRVSFADVDGTLIVVNGQKVFNVFIFDGSSITRLEKYLKVRDLFGVEDPITFSL